MKLKKIFLKNIRSYKSEEINFPEGSILLAGDIGSGKTSILLAIEYALFGLQPGQRGSSLLRNGANNGSVVLGLEVEGKKILIERRLKRNNKAVMNDYSSVLLDNGKIEASHTEIKTKVLEWLGYPKELIKKNNLLYRYTVYTPQEHMRQIILEDAETRLNILRQILGVDKYKRIRENLTILLGNIKEESKILQGETKSLDEEKSKLELKNSILKTLENEIKDKTKDLEIKIIQREKIESETINLEGKIREKENLEKEVEKTKIMINNKYDVLSNIQKEIQEIEKNISEAGELFNEEEYQAISINLNQKNEIIENLNARYTNFLSEINSLEKQQQESIIKKERIFKIDLCPTCLQDVPEAHKHNILNETENMISRLKRKITFLEEEISLITNEINKRKSEKRLLEEKKYLKEALRTKSEYLEKTKKRNQTLKESYECLIQDVALLNNHTNILRGKIFELSKFSNIIKIKKTELQNAFQEERKSEISLAEIKKETDMVKNEILEKEKSIGEKEKLKTKLNYILELYDWLSLNFLEFIEFTERNILIKLRQDFTKIFSKWFNMLVPHCSLNVRLDESFSPIILHNDIEMEYSFLSGGERTAVALAYRLALNQTINSMYSKIKTKDIVILDEPTDGFSEAQLDKMREVLNELNVSQLIIVSHEQKIESFVDNIIKIKKTEDVSQLESSHIEINEDEMAKYKNEQIQIRKT